MSALAFAILFSVIWSATLDQDWSGPRATVGSWLTAVVTAVLFLATVVCAVLECP